jgi:alkanesulfonate monooxygenase SsuD/methylene tetrahydromethanopterin reductase-like flavin-dependent oxidoreductase (luciferase family)
MGYDSVWLPDHLIGWEEAVPRLEAWQALAGLATVTTKIQLGPLVSPVTFRHPAVLANMAATLDWISGGRTILGLGAGGMPAEHRQYGLPFGTARERGQRLDEAATVVRALFEESSTSFRGTYYQLEGARAAPKPLQSHLPLLIAGSGRGPLRVAARLGDMWNAIGLPALFAEKVPALHAQVLECGRDPAEIMATASFRLIIREDDAEVSQRLDELDPVWRIDANRIAGGMGAVLERLRQYVRAGVGGLIVQMPAPFDFVTLERFAVEGRAALVGGR